MSREREAEAIEGFYEEVDTYGLVPNLRQCLQCGKCTGGCPCAAISPSYNPRQVIREILAGNADKLLKSEEIQRCFWCASCYMGCPVDIHFPLLMMQLRYRAFERGLGLRYLAPFKKFSLRARTDGMTFIPSPKNQERIKKLRTDMGVVPWPEISEKARADYAALFDLTGTTAWLESIPDEFEDNVTFEYVEGRITHE